MSREEREDFASLCRRICDDQGWTLQPNGICVPLPEGRQQVVGLEFFEEDEERLVRMFTTIGAAARLSPIRLEAALQINARLAHGAFALREGDLVMVETLMLDDADEGEIEASVRYLAATADQYEQQIFQTDDN